MEMLSRLDTMEFSKGFTLQSRLFVEAQDFASPILDYINTKPKPVAESLRITGQSRLFVEAQDFASPILDYINTKPKPVA
ncbi:hypothetical protein, partial [Membranihabitans marinus]|uniref:hypothetical protein n=1 Tax=Membranihabitans marinus TaxID=1227546 RepID=UPI001F39CF77